jgi:hypothetical protein
MKTLRSKDVVDVPCRQVKPGMVIAEGIVLAVDLGQEGTVFYTTPGTDVSADHGTTVQVYAKLGDLETEAIQDAYKSRL